MRSPIQQFEEWIFKRRRTNNLDVFNKEIEATKSFRETIEKTNCPACSHKTLELAKFERGPKGWEADVKCGNCDFNGVSSSLSTVFFAVNSKGKAVSTEKRKPLP